MIESRIRIATSLIVVLALAAGIAGCRIRTEKDANGEEKKVQIDTPFGGLHVNTDQTTAADLGLPVYPGAQQVTADDKHKSADVHLGFGDWELRVRAVSYATKDSQDQVVTFYKKALARYGDVITCRDNAAVGSPAVTAEGLTCDDNDKNSNVRVDRKDYNTGKDSLELKAGSKRRQHIVGFEDSKEGETRFALVALDLPAGMDMKSGKSD
jgi:hypothetical protein